MSSNRTYLTIVNGSAGGGRCRSRANSAVSRLHDRGMELNVVFTEGPDHASQLAKQGYAEGYRRFLSVGGDGTLCEVVNGLFNGKAPEDVVVGVLPLGTGNSFLRDFGITSEEQALDVLQRAQARAIDVLRIEHEAGVIHHINTLGTGFVSRVGSLTNRRFKTLGNAGYIAAVITSLVNLRYCKDRMRLDGKLEIGKEPYIFAAISNSQFTGGAMHMAPKAQIDDGELDVIIVGGMSRFELLRAFPSIYAGKHVDFPLVESYRARDVEFIEPREQDVLIDGELRTLAIKRISVLPKAIGVIA